MKRFFLYGISVAFCFVIVQTVYGLTYKQGFFYKNYSIQILEERKSIVQKLGEEFDSMYIQLNEKFKNESTTTACVGPTKVNIKNLKGNEVKIEWEDGINTSWEYFLQDAALPAPVASGTISNLKSATVKLLSGSGVALQPGTEYDFYVRSSCSNLDKSKWIGPLRFKTPCIPYATPFVETFNTTSTSFNCWGVIDNNSDQVSAPFIGVQNTWITSTTSYEGGRGMYFNGKVAPINAHDDWLISPPITMDGTKIYRMEYYYRTLAGTAYDNFFEVLASNNGSGPDDFTQSIIAKKSYENTTFMKDFRFVTGLNGDISFAWKVTGEKEVRLYIDKFSIVEVTNCPEPIDLKVNDVGEDNANLEWEDNFGAKEWEYVVQEVGKGLPLAGGVKVTTNSPTANTDSSGSVLEPNTQYEYYVRTVCSNGSFSDWSGPVSFFTMCVVYDTPYWDGFNSNLTNNCWTIINGNDDTNKWAKNTTSYEGGFSMYFSGSGAGKVHDDWLITPRVKMDKTKTYRLRFHYRNVATAISTNELEVSLSNEGTDKSDFKTIVIPKKQYETFGNWIEERVFISGIGGNVNIGFQLVTKETAYFYIDNVFIEEVKGCPEPIELGVEDVKMDEVTLSWKDDINKNGWEYYVQESGKGTPNTNGTSTKNKKNKVLKLNDGTALQPNTEYEYYVRSVCGNGEYSIWNGPYVFYTACSVMPLPYWEGFNTDSETKRCWAIIDGNKDGLDPSGSNIWRSLNFAFEGDKGMDFYGVAGKKHDDWLISPTFSLDGGIYVLKYHYKTNASAALNSGFEVLLSVNGIAFDQFVNPIVSKTVYREGNYVEGVAFINGIKDNANLAWHILSEGTTYVYLDNVFLKKVETCPEPYYVKVTGQTKNSIDIEWQQYGGITEWEVYVSDFAKSAPSVPATVIKVSGTPKVNLPGLLEGKGYSIYVRSVCDTIGTYSEWSTPVNTSTYVGTNDVCDGALNIPVNSGLDCDKIVSGSFLNASLSIKPESLCEPSKAAKRDVWFEFTAIATEHMLSLKDFYSVSLGKTSQLISGSLYDVSCSSIAGGAIKCFSLSSTLQNAFFTNLIPGTKYYVRLGVFSSNSSAPPPDFVFNLCLTTAISSPLEVSPSGVKYSVEELVKDVLIQSECDLVSNIKFQAGDKTSINTLGYFNKGNSIFPFEEGIVLATGDVKHIPGPYTYQGLSDERNKVPAWSGDPDLNEVIEQIGGAGFGSNKYVSILEFDFIPITDSIKFEYLFASQSYGDDCAYACREGGAIFAAWLTDVETGVGQNLALVPGTDLPIALSTIRDSKKSGVKCESVNPEFYGKHYTNNQDNVLEAPVNFVGLTVPMSSETVRVQSCKKYRIKLAIADFCGTKGHTSAVFFNAGSFNIGKIDLGKDLLIETNNAICSDEIRTINSGIGVSDCGNTDIEWYKDGTLIPNEKGGSLAVSESGSYEIKVKYTDINCQSSGVIKVEMYEPISKFVGLPTSISVCRNSLRGLNLDLGEAEVNMFKARSRDNYIIDYYESKQNAEDNVSPIIDIHDYSFDTRRSMEGFYIRIEDKTTGCYEIYRIPVLVEVGDLPATRENVKVCASYVFPDLESNQFYYSESAGNGVQFKVGDVLDIVGGHTIYVLQKNNEEGCYEETSYEVEITEMVKADVFEDLVLDCEIHVLGKLSENNKYFEKAGGEGEELAIGTPIFRSKTIYIYASSEDGLCTDESSYAVLYEDCPIQKGISPNGDGVNDYFDLSNHRVSSLKIYNRFGSEVYSYGKDYSSEWGGDDKNGNKLPDGTYYYVVISDGKTRTGWIQINR